MKYDTVGAESIKLSWEPPKADGGAPITNYIVDKRETSRAEWAQVSSKIAATVTECTALKLIEGREYQFRVRAANRFGAGDPIISDPVVARYPYSKLYLHIQQFCLWYL